MHTVARKVLDDVVKTSSFLIGTAALYLAACAFESHVLKSDYLWDNSFGKAMDSFMSGSKKKSQTK